VFSAATLQLHCRSAYSPRVRKMQFHLSRGLDIPMAGPPRADVHAKPVASVALLPGDYPGIKPVLRVEEGERVSLDSPCSRTASIRACASSLRVRGSSARSTGAPSVSCGRS